MAVAVLVLQDGSTLTRAVREAPSEYIYTERSQRVVCQTPSVRTWTAYKLGLLQQSRAADVPTSTQSCTG